MFCTCFAAPMQAPSSVPPKHAEECCPPLPPQPCGQLVCRQPVLPHPELVWHRQQCSVLRRWPAVRPPHGPVLVGYGFRVYGRVYAARACAVAPASSATPAWACAGRSAGSSGGPLTGLLIRLVARLVVGSGRGSVQGQLRRISHRAYAGRGQGGSWQQACAWVGASRSGSFRQGIGRRQWWGACATQAAALCQDLSESLLPRMQAGGTTPWPPLADICQAPRKLRSLVKPRAHPQC